MSENNTETAAPTKAESSQSTTFVPMPGTPPWMIEGILAGQARAAARAHEQEIKRSVHDDEIESRGEGLVRTALAS